MEQRLKNLNRAKARYHRLTSNGICPGCGINSPILNKIYCVDCTARKHDRDILYRINNKEKRDKWQKDYYKRNYNRIRVRRYEITFTEYKDLLETQKGLCKICQSSNNGKTLHIDHDHVTGKVRGLLCNQCNVGLGSFRDNPELLQGAIEYLTTHKLVS